MSQEDKTLCEELVLDWLVDETVPAGWSHRTVPGCRKVLVRDPSGRKYDGRRKAILHLLESSERGDERDLAVSVLTAGLELEGWTEITNDELCGFLAIITQHCTAPLLG